MLKEDMEKLLTEFVDDYGRVEIRTMFCPVCKHETLTKSLIVEKDDGKRVGRYCFVCGNTFLKDTKWVQESK